MEPWVAQLVEPLCGAWRLQRDLEPLIMKAHQRRAVTRGKGDFRNT